MIGSPGTGAINSGGFAMGYVEMMETIRRISSIPIPPRCSLMFAMTLGGLTYSNLVINAKGFDVNGSKVEAEWNIEAIPTSEKLEEFTVRMPMSEPGAKKPKFKTAEYICEVRPGGKLPGHISDAIKMVLNGRIGKLVKITLTEPRKLRSLSQNAFYWGFVIPPMHAFMIESGNDMDPEEVHNFLKENVARSIFMRVIVLVKRHGDGTETVERKPYLRSSTTLDTLEWEDYIERIRAFGAENHVRIPFPNEDA
jgi:hypothetical protein